MQLPPKYLQRMQALLGDEYPAFLQSYEEERTYGLRVNTLKVAAQTFAELAPFHLEPISWAQEGFYYRPEDKPGKHPYHAAGLYYIQEPSAMAVVSVLDPQPGERVLDIAAAPGGKATHIAAKLQGRGLLIANEIVPSRAKVLSQNVERLGIKNCVVTNEPPEVLAERFPQFFHRVLVDAPCSGEGMFRKDPEVVNEWSTDHVIGCSMRQQNILNSSAELIAPGGILVYSTCTFNPVENEQVISHFLEKHPEFSLVQVEGHPEFAPGNPSWANSTDPELTKTVRLWPHRLKGEGHFLAVMRKTDGPAGRHVDYRQQEATKADLKPYLEWAGENLNVIPEGQAVLFGPHLYLVPEGCPSLAGLKVLRPGWHLGEVRKRRFIPGHALALALNPAEVKCQVDLASESEEVQAYLRGETLNLEGEEGWHLVSVDGFSLGWGKLTGTTLKNHYPKGLRWSL
ncbi:MAG: RsmF rRNA methyltransferase first C-terminal domain-containing protein [Firmicutes bacterium]|nr:RsmF rRNA methyltransferase first C-terminal domain-containing protein [Bacillota bacterium]